MQTFSVSDWLANDQPRLVEFARPRQVGCWSKQSSQAGGAYEYGQKFGLLPYKQPELPIDLNDGFPDKYIRKPPDQGTPVEHVIEAALHAGVDVARAHVVTFRNNLNKITLTSLASDKQEDTWVVDGCCTGGTLFLDIVKTEEKTFVNSEQFEYYGYKFESVCTGGLPGAPVDSTSEYSSLLRLRLGRHHILMAAEIDCCDPQAAGKPGTREVDSYLELKVYKPPSNAYQRKQAAKEKYPRWWVQSFLAGVPRLMLGCRDASGSLNGVTSMDVITLPSRSAEDGQPFDAWRLLRFTEELLDWMLQASRRAPDSHLRFEFVPGKKLIKCTVLPGGALPHRLAAALHPPARNGAGAGGGDTDEVVADVVSAQPVQEAAPVAHLDFKRGKLAKRRRQETAAAPPG